MNSHSESTHSSLRHFRGARLQIFWKTRPQLFEGWSTFHRITRYPVDKRQQNKPRYPLDSDLSGG